jgi:hypothetical protein
MGELIKVSLLWGSGLAYIASTVATMVLLWGWFVVPLGVPPIGIAHAFGLCWLASFLNGSIGRGIRLAKERGDEDRDERNKRVFADRLTATMLQLFICLICWGARLVMVHHG